jgi:thiol-disulfide isomerase/thioredoxin
MGVFLRVAAGLAMGAVVVCGTGPDGTSGVRAQELAPGAAAKNDSAHPYPLRLEAPPLDAGAEWVNVERPIQLADLRGRFVLLDFWTFCCINCMQELPEIKKLEAAFPNELVVIGVHSAKFAGEQDSQNIREAVMRYEIEHPVVNDAKMAI